MTAIAAIGAAFVFYARLGQRRRWAFLPYGLREIISGFGIIIFTLFPPDPGMLANQNPILSFLFNG
jgi:hypothetical protein